MEKLWDSAHEKLINITGGPGVLDQYLWMSAIPWPSMTKSAQKQ